MLGDESDPWQFLAQRISEAGIEGLWFPEGESDGVPFCLPNVSLISFKLFMKHYFKDVEVIYYSPLEFFVGELIFRSAQKRIREHLAQIFFNRKHLVRSDRITVLQYIFNKTLNDRSFNASPSILMTEFYGPRWAGHSDNLQLLNYYVLLLDSLVSTGDLSQDKIVYHIKPSALATLAQHEEEERRHKDQVRQQGILGLLTAALVIVGVIQVYVTYTR